jgi:hypothetical protein
MAQKIAPPQGEDHIHIKLPEEGVPYTEIEITRQKRDSSQPGSAIEIEPRLCKCGCGMLLAPKAGARRFINKSHKDRYWNDLRQRKTSRKQKTPASLAA